jgi:DivIVA domain-containing protein
MDVTPQLLREVEFREKFRGYDPDQVDELLERAGQQIAQLQGRLREALERAEAAEAKATAGGGGYGETEETLRRTLVLAQRTADAVVAEAEELATRTRKEADDHARRVRAEADDHSASTLAEARVEAKRLVGDAAAQAEAIRSEAAAEARRVIEATRMPLREEITELEQVRDQLRDDVDILSRHVDEQRERLSTTLAALQATVDEPGALRVGAAPATSAVTLPEPRDHDLDLDEEPVPVDDRPAPAAADRLHDEPDDGPSATAAFVPVLADEVAEAEPLDLRSPPPQEELVELAVVDEELADEAGPAGPEDSASVFEDEWDEEDWDEPTVSPEDIEAPSPGGSTPAAEGPSGELFADDDPSPASDPFLDQLRSAVDETDDDTTRAMEAFFEPDDDERRSRFGRRR